MTEQTDQKQSTAARFLKYMIENKPDLLFGIIRNTIPNLAMPNKGPVFITRFNDVQEALQRPDIFRVTYAPMIDPSVGPFMLGRDNTTINQRDKGIMRSLLQREDLPKVRETVARLTKEQLAKLKPERQIEVVREISRGVPVRFTGAFFGFPGPDLDAMYRWSRATQYDMFHNQENNEKIHQDNVQAGKEMHEYMPGLLEQRRKELEEDPELDDTVSRLLKSKFVKAIDFDELAIMRNIMGLLVGGVETTSQAIVQIMDQLFKRPSDLEGAKKAANDGDDALLYQYCWEALRFNPINPFVIRYCAQDYKIAAGTLRGRTIK